MNPRLVEWLGSVSGDPYAFVLGAFPWGEPGSILEREDGPEAWQRELLCAIRDRVLTTEQAIRTAVASGHGIGKSACVAWIILWAISTLPDTRGVVTANTENQLKTKTWAELGKWHRLFIGRYMFKLTATALFQAERERTWRIDMIPWSEKNTEAFQGLHNKGRRLLLIFDEASKIEDKIWEVAEGAMTDVDTQIIWCVFGNPTQNTGRFRECWGKFEKFWWKKQVDSRTVRFTNRKEIDTWETVWGEDSDFFRIRVKGEFPRVGEMEFISTTLVTDACAREAEAQKHDPLCLGVDVARYGSNETVLFFRKGRDARSIAPVRMRGADTVAVASRIADLVRQYHVDAVFVDGGGVGGGVVDNLRHLHIHCFDINFGAKPDSVGFTTGVEGERYANKRAEMWGLMRGWLRGGALPDITDLREQLIAPTYTFNLRNEIQLEKKEDMMKRGVASPDIADALALTFAYPVASHANAGGEYAPKSLVVTDYDPYAREALETA